jgi:hypothetical protein
MSLNRCTEPGWIELSRPDGRRGMWMRVTDNCIELCAGREGDDAHLSLTLGSVLSRRDLAEAEDILKTFQWAKEVSVENAGDAARLDGGAMITVTHTCGHTQDCRFDELAEKLVAMGKRTQAQADEFIANQRRWLECNLCPSCYCAAKQADPNTKPRDPPNVETIMRDTMTATLVALIGEREARE